jgi:hypothetical protein
LYRCVTKLIRESSKPRDHAAGKLGDIGRADAVIDRAHGQAAAAFSALPAGLRGSATLNGN